MVSKYIGCIVAALVLISVPIAQADSLWLPVSTSMFTDIKAKQVGDLVTVMISEGASSTVKASTDVAKDMEHSNQAGIGPFLRLIPELGFSSGQSSSASGQTTMTSTFVAKVTATVTKVLENGNLEIQAKRTVVTNGEKQEITLTGIVRQMDIAADNTVMSTYL
ncbi:MAG TPA: flagellar basal body L-ring protein FlgH, partial [Armatimonadota bacterium]|nr:flagellar basal body L-ring protein FlgH [Armatimonadota bacterium]